LALPPAYLNYNSAGSTIELIICPVGIILYRSLKKDQAPIQSMRSQAIGTDEVYTEFSNGFQNLEGFLHITLFYVLHHSNGYFLRVKLFLDIQKGIDIMEGIPLHDTKSCL
jgi:tRNA (Thr-GGU) A37 N-methylase